MSYKLIILAPSCGGKSSLMRYMRKHTDIEIAETDEEVMKANHNVWPDNDLKNAVLVPKTTREIIRRSSVIYFASYIPTYLIKEAKSNGFSVVILKIFKRELIKRNLKRVHEEGYDDVSTWFKGQLDNFKELASEGLIDTQLDGNQEIKKVADEILQLTKQ